MTDFFAERNSGKLPSPKLKRNYSQVPHHHHFWLREERPLHQCEGEKRGSNGWAGPGKGLHTGLGRQAHEGPTRTSSHFDSEAGTQSEDYLSDLEILEQTMTTSHDAR